MILCKSLSILRYSTFTSQLSSGRHWQGNLRANPKIIGVSIVVPETTIINSLIDFLSFLRASCLTTLDHAKPAQKGFIQIQPDQFQYAAV